MANDYENIGIPTGKSGALSSSEWQLLNADALTRSTCEQELEKTVASAESARELLLKVPKTTYAVDPLVASQIAAVTQYAMVKGREDVRQCWTKALMAAIAEAYSEYRILFYLEQLRWCAFESQAEKIAEVTSYINSIAVDSFLRQLMRELGHPLE